MKQFGTEKISIITVVYNSEDLIEDTILSVLNQKYSNLEYIVVDGASTDKTVEIISKYLDRIDVFISEPDLGIYNAMNKALSYVTGEWVNFMNAGDLFYNFETINTIFGQGQVTNSGVSIIYGNHVLMYKDAEVLRIPRSLNLLWTGMTIQHQSIFVNSKVCETEKFNENYRFAADFDLFYKCYKKNLKINKANLAISKVTPGGFSESNSVKTYLEFMHITLNYEKNILIKFYYCCLIPKIYLVSQLKRFL